MKISFNPAITTYKKVNQGIGSINFGRIIRDENTPINQNPIPPDTFERQVQPQPVQKKTEVEKKYPTVDKTGDDIQSIQKLTDVPEKFTVTDYDNLYKDDVAGLRYYADETIMQAADRTAHLGVKLKRRLDRLYGKDNYVFVAVGAKPSLVGRAFECQGVETRYLPTPRAKFWEKTFNSNSIQAFGNFMESQDLNKDAMEASPKKYLFFEYTYGDNSRADTLKTFLTTKYGLPEDRVEVKSIETELKQVNASKDIIDDYLSLYFKKNEAEKLSGIGILPSYSLTEQDFEPKKITLYSDEAVRVFQFLLMDKLNQIGTLEENPDNDIAL